MARHSPSSNLKLISFRIFCLFKEKDTCATSSTGGETLEIGAGIMGFKVSGMLDSKSDNPMVSTPRGTGESPISKPIRVDKGNSRRALRQWSDRFHRVPIRIILNQTAPGPSLPAEAIERTLRRPLVGTIPFDPAQARALTQRAPLALHNPDSPLAQAVQGLAQTLVRVTSG